MGLKKASAKQDAATLRRQKRQNRRNDKDFGGDEAEMKLQLEKLGLTLKEISGDGNCLFRALADQLYGNSKAVGGYHLKLRREVVSYMRAHPDDFAPFVDEDITFEKHLDLLEQDGTYAGQDALVAFSRLYGVTIVIHQLNEPLWQIHGSSDGQSRCPCELHISFHNGDHYNSVRKVGDLLSNEPANLKIELVAPLASKLSNYEDFDEDESVSSDREVCQKSGSERNSLDKEESGKDVSKGEKSKSYKKPTKPDSKNSKKKQMTTKKAKPDSSNETCVTLVPAIQTLSL